VLTIDPAVLSEKTALEPLSVVELGVHQPEVHSDPGTLQLRIINTTPNPKSIFTKNAATMAREELTSHIHRPKDTIIHLDMGHA